MRNLLRNNRGFTLLEILVTVGIVGVLSAVAVPAYNQYKKGTIETAIESDIGNFQKAYMAYNAINGTYCTTFATAGIQMRDSRNYAKKGAIGFANVNASCGGTPTTAPNYKPPAVTLAACSTHGNATDCGAVPGCTWASSACGGTPSQPSQGTIAACELDIDQFIMGATTNVSGINKVWGINEEGKIKDNAATTTGTVTCPALTADWDLPATNVN